MNLFKGYIELNDDKTSKDKYKDVPLKTLEQVEDLSSYGGVIDKSVVLVDFDSYDEGSKALEIVKALKLDTVAYKTTRGLHLWFAKDSNIIQKNYTKHITPIGLTCDYKGFTNSYAVLKLEGVEREIVYQTETLEPIPPMFKPLGTDKRYNILDLEEGTRNDTLFQYILYLQDKGLDKEQIRHIYKIINEHILDNPIDDTELKQILRDESFKQVVPTWINENLETGRKSLNTGLLAEHLATNESVKTSNEEFYIYDNGVYEAGTNNKIKGYVMEYIPTELRRTRDINDIVNQWSYYNNLNVDVNEWNNNNYMLNLKNGMYDLKNRKLIEHSPNYLSTVRINASYKEDTEGKEWDKFIERVVPDPTYRLMVQEIFGYSLTMFNNIKKFFILDGKSNTGKSVYLNVLSALIGEQNISNIPLQDLSDRFNKAELYGKVANIFGDLPNTPIKDNLIKALTGGDRTNAEYKNGQPFTFTNRAKVICSTNGLPSNYGDRSDAFYNRLMILPFNEVIPVEEQNPNLVDDLLKESDYILKWGLEGLHRVIDNNFTITEHEGMKDAIADYKTDSNVVMQFIEEKFDVFTETNNTDNKHVVKAELYDMYRNYCLSSGHTSPLTKRNFYKEILELGYRETRPTGSSNMRIRNLYPKDKAYELDDAIIRRVK